jgi:hypothetical protein
MRPEPTIDFTRLRDLAMPGSVSYMPQTAGWYVLGVIVLALIACAVARVIGHRRANRYRREALDELSDIERRLPSGVTASLVVEIDTLAKRVALVAFGRETVASLAGSAWLTFLDRTSRSTAFSAGAGSPLGELPYRSSKEREAMSLEQASALTDVVRRWIRSHRVPV